MKPTDATVKIGVIAITEGEILIEKTGERMDAAHLCDTFASASESIVVSDGMDHVFHELTQKFRDDPNWQFKTILQEMEGDARANHVISYFGWKRTNHHARRRARYFYPIGIQTFVPDLSQFRGDDELTRLLNFGITLRDFCIAMRIRPRSSGAGLASQLLRHPKFYPEPRRRIPTFINEIARTELPGNHYDLFAVEGERFKSATYIDQSAAHHYAAQTTPLPCANTTHANGHTKGDKVVPWLYPNEEGYSTIINQHGLLRARITVPAIPLRQQKYVPALLREEGTKDAYIWTNELELLEQWGARVEFLIAALTSPNTDTGLPSYSRWAVEQPKWMKRALLTPYGVLASRQRRTRFVYARGKGDKVKVPMGPHLIEGVSGGIREFGGTGTTNVLQRGLIEAYVRRLSLELCHELDRDGRRVISIYGDGVFVRAQPGEQLEMIGPWRVKREVHNLRFQSATQLRSDEITRLPGTPRFFRDYHRQASAESA